MVEWHVVLPPHSTRVPQVAVCLEVHMFPLCVNVSFLWVLQFPPPISQNIPVGGLALVFVSVSVQLYA